MEELGETGSFPDVPVEECPGSITIVIFEFSSLESLSLFELSSFELSSLLVVCFLLESFFSLYCTSSTLLVSFSLLLSKLMVTQQVTITKILVIINSKVIFLCIILPFI